MKNYTYELTNDGYYILIDGVKVIHQYGEYIPNKNLSYEENALAQIEELKQTEKNIDKEVSNAELQEQITDIQLVLTEMYESGV